MLAHLEQPIALAHGPLVAAERGAKAGRNRDHETVEETPPLGPGAGEEPIHGGNEEDLFHVVAERAGACVFPGDANGAARAVVARARRVARPNIEFAMARPHARGDREAALAIFPRKLRIRASAQPVAGTQKGDRFEEIGLARPVLAGKNNGARVEVEPGGRVVAKVRKLQCTDGKCRCAGLGLVDLYRVLFWARGHTRIGIST